MVWGPSLGEAQLSPSPPEGVTPNINLPQKNNGSETDQHDLT
jgi:hypothetical protein